MVQNLMRKEYLEWLVIHGDIILKRILGKEFLKMSTN